MSKFYCLITHSGGVFRFYQKVMFFYSSQDFQNNKLEVRSKEFQTKVNAALSNNTCEFHGDTSMMFTRYSDTKHYDYDIVTFKQSLICDNPCEYAV